MILRLTPRTAELIGETPAEWQLLEKQVRAGRWTSGPRTDVARLRALAAESRRGGARGRRGGVETAAASPAVSVCFRGIDRRIAYANSVVEE